MAKADTIHLSVIIPAFNEEDRVSEPLEEVVEYLERQPFSSEVICVDDGSTDHTPEILCEAAERWPSLRVVRYEQNHGKGYAVQQGVLAARGEWVLFSDADMNTPIEEIEKLWRFMDGGDIVIGSRADKSQDRPVIRELGSRTLNLLIRTLAVPGIRDTQCGFKLFKREAARSIFELSFLEGFSFDIEVLYLARRLGYKVIEVPVVWYYRGGSKVRPVADGLRFIRDMIRIRRHNYKPGDV